MFISVSAATSLVSVSPEEQGIRILLGDDFQNCSRILYVGWFDSGFMSICLSTRAWNISLIFYVKVALGSRGPWSVSPGRLMSTGKLDSSGR